MSAQISPAIMPVWFILEFLSQHPYLASAGTLFGLLAAYQKMLPSAYPANLPLIREPTGTKSFSFKTRVAFHSECIKLFSDAYELVF